MDRKQAQESGEKQEGREERKQEVIGKARGSIEDIVLPEPRVHSPRHLGHRQPAEAPR
jgi:hypothetical protein